MFRSSACLVGLVAAFVGAAGISNICAGVEDCGPKAWAVAALQLCEQDYRNSTQCMSALRGVEAVLSARGGTDATLHALHSAGLACGGNTTSYCTAHLRTAAARLQHPAAPSAPFSPQGVKRDTCEANIISFTSLCQNASKEAKLATQICLTTHGDTCVNAVSFAAQTVYSLQQVTPVLNSTCCVPGATPQCVQDLQDVILIANASAMDMKVAEAICGPVGKTLPCTINTGIASADLDRALFLLNNYIVGECH